MMAMVVTIHLVVQTTLVCFFPKSTLTSGDPLVVVLVVSVVVLRTLSRDVLGSINERDCWALTALAWLVEADLLC